MSYGKMAPQAYTKETLQEAFEWWSKQSDDFRSQIQDKDDLVGYYLRSRGEAPSKAEKSEGFTETAKASFASELKGLAKNLETFEDYAKPKSKMGSGPSPRDQKPIFEPVQQMQFPDLSKSLVPTEDEKAWVVEAKNNNNPSVKSSFFKLDPQSKATVLRAKEALNLSSEDEALRALIALGKSKIKSIF